MLKLVLELFFCEGVLHRVVVVLQAIHGLNLRLVSPRSRLGTSLLPDCTINFRLGQTSFLVRDGVSGCSTAFNLFFMSAGPSAFNCVRCTLPEKSSGPYSSGSDFAFVFGSSILQACSYPFRACVSSTYLPRTCPVLLLLNHALQCSICLMLLFL